MFERLTEHARGVLTFAQEEARALQHDYVGTGHLLLGLLRDEEGLAARVLDSFGITIGEVRTRVAALVGGGEGAAEQIPLTPTANGVIERALQEALRFGDNAIGAEHILLALTCSQDSLAVQILAELGASATAIRDQVTSLLPAPGGQENPELIGWPGRPAAARQRPAASLPDGSTWVDGLEALLGALEREIQGALGRVAAIAVIDTQALARIRRLLGLPNDAPPGDTDAASQRDC